MVFPMIYKPSNMVAIRWFSDMNDWLDAVILVSRNDFEKAKDTLSKACIKYWNGEYDLYSVAIEAEMRMADIPYIAIYYTCPEENGDEKDEYDAEWTKLLGWLDVECEIH